MCAAWRCVAICCTWRLSHCVLQVQMHNGQPQIDAPESPFRSAIKPVVPPAFLHLKQPLPSIDLWQFWLKHMQPIGMVKAFSVLYGLAPFTPLVRACNRERGVRLGSV